MYIYYQFTFPRGGMVLIPPADRRSTRLCTFLTCSRNGNGLYNQRWPIAKAGKRSRSLVTLVAASRESNKGRTAIRVGKHFRLALMLAHETDVYVQIDINEQEVSDWRLWM